jgi:hypothetical protein
MVRALYTKKWSAVELLYCCRDSCVVRNLMRCAVSNGFLWLLVVFTNQLHLQPIVMVLFRTGQCSNTGCCISGDSYRSGSRRTVQQVNKVSGRRLVHCDEYTDLMGEGFGVTSRPLATVLMELIEE